METESSSSSSSPSSSVDVPALRLWDELIPDALGLIFKHLPLQQVLTVIPRVCKPWRRAVEGPYCWQVIDIDEWSTECGPKRLDRMLRMLVARAGGSLRELYVSCVNDYQTFSFIAQNASSLRALHFRRSDIIDSVISQHTHHFPNLTTLDLSYCCNVSALTFESLGRNCPSLTSLSWNMHPISNKSTTLGAADESRAISQHLPQLRQLGIAYLNIDTASVHDIIRGCPELELLDLRGCWGVKIDKKGLEEKRPGLKVLGPIVTMGYFESCCCLDDCSDCSDDEDEEEEFDEDGGGGWMMEPGLGLGDYDDEYADYYVDDLEAYLEVDDFEMRFYEGGDESYWPASP